MISRSRTFSGLVPALLCFVSAGGCDRSAGTPAPGPATVPAPSPSDPSSPTPPVETGDDQAEAEADGEVEADVDDDDEAAAKCGDQVCTPPQTCVEYYGIAGANGPKFQSCEVRCKGVDDTRCPAGTRCTTVADGPGQVCR